MAADLFGDLDLVRIIGDRASGAFGALPQQGQRLAGGERRHGQDVFVDPADRFATGGQDGQRGRRRQQFGDHPADAAEHVLAVVQHQDSPLAGGLRVGEGAQQQIPLRRIAAIGAHHRPHHVLVGEPVLAFDLGQPGPIHRSTLILRDAPQGFGRQPGLADAAGPHQGDQPGITGEQGIQAGQLGRAPDEFTHPENLMSGFGEHYVGHR